MMIPYSSRYGSRVGNSGVFKNSEMNPKNCIKREATPRSGGASCLA